jgi:alpha-amylase
MREKPIETGTKLLLCPGSSQVYYGDESSRSLVIEETEGDASLRSFMNWNEIESGASREGFLIDELLLHWQKLGRFRANHPSVGAGKHQMISESPYFFTRAYDDGDFQDKVLVGLGLGKGKKSMSVTGIFTDGTALKDYYSGQEVIVTDGEINFESDFDIVLLGE